MDRKTGHAAAGYYSRTLSKADRKAFEDAPVDLNLEPEIKLLRLVLARLSGDPLGNHAHIVRVVNSLNRLARTQVEKFGGVTALEQAISDAAEQVLEDYRTCPD